MAQRHGSGQSRQILIVEDLNDQSASFHPMELALFVDRNDTTSFLSSMLQGVQAIVGKFRGIRDPIYRENTTFIMNTSIHIHLQLIASEIFDCVVEQRLFHICTDILEQVVLITF